MFTIEQVKAAHAQVKSGADFPRYVQDMKALGVTSYEHLVHDGHINYKGDAGYQISGDAKYPAISIAAEPSTQELKDALSVHQQGQTDYFTFCRQAAAAGVEKWIVDMEQMTCVYYDAMGGSMLSEVIPQE